MPRHGQLWPLYQQITIGRRIDDHGRTGFVVFETPRDVFYNDIPTYKVRWEDDPSYATYTKAQLQPLLLDEFVEQDWIAEGVLKLQKSPTKRATRATAGNVVDNTSGGVAAAKPTPSPAAAPRSRSGRGAKRTAEEAAPVDEAAPDEEAWPSAPKAAPSASDAAVSASKAALAASKAATQAVLAASKAALAASKATVSAALTEATATATASPAEAVQVGAGDGIQSWTGRVYPRSLTYKPGDVTLQEREGMNEEEGDYIVEAIVDEARINGRQMALIKWQGYELSIGDGQSIKGDWEPVSGLKTVQPYIDWCKNKPSYFTAGASTSGSKTPRSGGSGSKRSAKKARAT